MGSTDGHAALDVSEARVGRRYLHHKSLHPITLRYIGPLPPPSSPADPGPSRQTWYGIEYDDASRGKHSGTYEDEQVFATRQPGAGAFVKAQRGVLREGKTFVQAVQERYGSLGATETDNGGGDASWEGKTEVVLGGSAGGIVVEAPGLGEVQKRLGQLERLREMGLEGEWLCRLGGAEQERKIVRDRLKNLKTLDFSKNLLSSWRDVAEIVEHLPGLRVLVLNNSRLEPLEPDATQGELGALNRIEELYLGRCGMTWDDICHLSVHMPNLQCLHVNDNMPLDTLQSQTPPSLAHLHTLSLDGCGIDSWDGVVEGLAYLPQLTTLNLSRLPFPSISPPSGSPPSSSLSITDLYLLDETHLTSWSSIDSLNLHFPNLRALRFSLAAPPEASGEPHCISGDLAHDRPILIAKLPQLAVLNLTPVTAVERKDAETAYLTMVGRLVSSGRSRGADWARYEELCVKHVHSPGGEGVGMKDAPSKSILKSKMINLHILATGKDPFDMAVLPSSPVSLLRKKVARRLGVPPAEARIWTVRASDTERVAEVVEDAEEVGWWLADGDWLSVEAHGDAS